MTPEQVARAQGEQDASAAVADEERWRIAGAGMLTVHPVEAWGPRAHRPLVLG